MQNLKLVINVEMLEINYQNIQMFSGRIKNRNDLCTKFISYIFI